MSEYRPKEEQDESPEEIRADIVQTRADMGSTIDAIQEKLNPDALKAQVQDMVQERVEEVKDHVQDAIAENVEHVKSQVREATVGRVETMVSNVSDGMRGSGNGFLDTIKTNPVPTALVGIGLGWLLATRQNGKTTERDTRNYRGTAYGDGRYVTNGYGDAEPSVGDRLGDTVTGATDRVGQFANTAGDRVNTLKDQAGDRVGDLRDQAGDRVGAFTDRAQDTAMQAKGGFQQTLKDNPLTIGAVAVALGLAAGLALPGTPVEDRAFGETRDNLVGQVQAKAQDTIQKVQQVAQDVQQSATQTVKESAQRQGLAQTAQ